MRPKLRVTMPGSTARVACTMPMHVELEHAAELTRRRSCERRAFGAAGIGDQNVDRSARRFGLLARRFDRAASVTSAIT